jgi:pyruvate dehydrogenase E1 component alpha subunit
VKGTIKGEVEYAQQIPALEAKLDILFEDIYVPGSEPAQRRGRTVDETWY